MRTLKENVLIFIIGGILYTILEILWRGFTHWTMSLTGGICFILLYRSEIYFQSSKLWQKCLLGSIIITATEFTVGCIVNILLGWHIWDYSNTPFNIFGQVCLPFSALWFMLCIPVSYLCKFIRYRVFAIIIPQKDNLIN